MAGTGELLGQLAQLGTGQRVLQLLHLGDGGLLGLRAAVTARWSSAAYPSVIALDALDPSLAASVSIWSSRCLTPSSAATCLS